MKFQYLVYTHIMMTIIPINVVLPKAPIKMVLYDIRRSFTSREGAGDEIGRELMEVTDDLDKEMCGEMSREVEVDFLHETPATPTCLMITLPSSRERSSEGHSTSLFSDPVQETVDKCSVLSGLP